MKKVAVIGAGPAGIIAAGYSAINGKDTYLFDKNERIGKKLFITGKGRCNITNSADIEELIQNISVNKEFMYSGFYTFTNEDIINLIENNGTKTKVERGNRVFPKSDKSSDVIKALKKFLDESNVKLKLNTKVKSIRKDMDKFIISFDDSVESFDSVIIATGGASYPSTGSAGDGYKFAKSMGHTIIDIKPALVPCEIKESYISELQGLSLRNVSIKAIVGHKKVFEDFGEMVFTHYGISGPIVLSMSNVINKYIDKKIKISIDLKPSLDIEKLNNRLVRDFEKYSKKQFKNSLDDLFPSKLIPLMVKLSGIPEDKFVNQITREERSRLIHLIKNFELTFKSFRPISEAIVTSGGVSVKEINSSTMESKLIPGLYFAGEVIDLHAKTGGYNLQIAYSSGYLAGINS